MTLVGGQWSWKPNGEMYSLEETLRMLVNCVTGGGNLLLEYRTDAHAARSKPRQVDAAQAGWRLDQAPRRGDLWHARRPVPNGTWGGSTHRGNTVYVFAKNWQGDMLRLHALPGKSRPQRMVGGDAGVFQQTEKGIELTLAGRPPRSDSLP